MYRVIKAFTDLCDKNYPYCVGDMFPRAGATANLERIAELSGCNNKQGTPLIEPAGDETVKPAPVKKATKKTTAK